MHRLVQTCTTLDNYCKLVLLDNYWWYLDSHLIYGKIEERSHREHFTWGLDCLLGMNEQLSSPITSCKYIKGWLSSTARAITVCCGKKQQTNNFDWPVKTKHAFREQIICWPQCQTFTFPLPSSALRLCSPQTQPRLKINFQNKLRVFKRKSKYLIIMQKDASTLRSPV